MLVDLFNQVYVPGVVGHPAQLATKSCPPPPPPVMPSTPPSLDSGTPTTAGCIRICVPVGTSNDPQLVATNSNNGTPVMCTQWMCP